MADITTQQSNTRSNKCSLDVLTSALQRCKVVQRWGIVHSLTVHMMQGVYCYKTWNLYFPAKVFADYRPYKRSQLDQTGSCRNFVQGKQALSKKLQASFISSYAIHFKKTFTMDCSIKE